MKAEDFIVIGFVKSGQNSMVEYLQKRFKIFTRKDEIPWRKDAIDIYERKYLSDGTKPVFITRNPVDRIWSHYHYFNWNERMSFEEFLRFRDYNTVLGEENPISQSNYEKWIKPFMKYDPIIVSVEEMDINPNFPKINETSEKHGGYKTGGMPQHYRELVEELMKKEIETFKEPTWSIDEEYDEFFL